MSHRIVVTGAGGKIGRYVAAGARRRGYEVSALTRRHLDITDSTAARRHLRCSDVLVNCAAFAHVDAAECEPQTALAVNAVAAGNLARACATVGARMIHLSSNYVFSGDQTGRVSRPYDIFDEPEPINAYGRSKGEGELAVKAELPEAQVVRTSWVYTGRGDGDFVATMCRIASTEQIIDVVSDQTGSPTYIKDLVAALLEIADGGVRGTVLHAANAGAATSFDQARAVFGLLGADPDRVQPIVTAEIPRPASRPPYAALSMAESVRTGLSALRPWEDALAEAVGDVGGRNGDSGSGDLARSG